MQSLERSGDINGLQWKRWFAWQKELKEAALQKDGYTDEVSGMLMTEIELRENAQSEIAKQLQLETAQVHLQQCSQKGTEKYRLVSKTKTLRQKLAKLSREYWFLERKWWSQRVKIQEGGDLSLGIDLWRSNPSWYMHRSLVQDCVERGGCCGRDCNCCPTRRSIPGRRFAAGHCTTRCHCCEEARGFKLSSKETKNLHKEFSFSSLPYYHRIRNASLFGLIGGNNKDSPFDLIVDSSNLPPAYTTSTSSL